jgi:hypothetical protein
MAKLDGPGFDRGLTDTWARMLAGMSALDHHVTAMVRYFDLYADWTPTSITTPVLWIRASGRKGTVANEGAAASTPVGADRLVWSCQQSIVSVAGDHFSMLGTHAEATVTAMERWLKALRTLPQGASRGPALLKSTA